MEQWKLPWWATSRGVVGGLVAFIGAAAGWTLDETAEWTDIVLDGTTALAALVAVYGRAQAQKKIETAK